MKAVFVEPMGAVPGKGTTSVWAMVVSDDTPAELPTTGENVEGMNADQTFAPFSVLYVVGEADQKVFLANEQGEFVPQ